MAFWRVTYRDGMVLEVEADTFEHDSKHLLLVEYRLVINRPRRIVALRADPRELLSIKRNRP
jgi:hypothetical protein